MHHKNQNGCTTQPDGVVKQISPDSLLSFWQGCRYLAITAQDFATSLELGLFNALPDFDNGSILMVNNGQLVEIPNALKYDAELDAITYDGKIIANEVETSNDTFQISQRVGLASFGTQLSIVSVFDGTKSIPVFTKYDENGTLGIFQQVIGPEIPFVIQGGFDETYTLGLYDPPVTVGGTENNVIRGRYRFAEAGLNVRIKTTATNLEGRELILFGTEAYPFQNVVTKAYNGTPESETVVEYSGAVADVPGFIYDTIIETYDPDTLLATGAPLNVLGTQVNGEFRIYLELDVQSRQEVQLQSGGNVIGSGAALDSEIVITDGASITNVKSSGLTLADLPQGDVKTVGPAVGELDVSVDSSDPANLKLTVAGMSDIYPVFAFGDTTLGLTDRFIICQPVFQGANITLTLPDVSAAESAKYFVEVYNDSVNTNFDAMVDDALGNQVISVKPLDRVLVFALGNSWETIVLSSQFFSDSSISGVGSFADPAKVDIDNIAESASRVFIDPASKTVLENTSNINTGDETTLSIQQKRPLKTFRGVSLEGTGDIVLPKLYGHRGRGAGNEFTTTSDVFQLVDTWNLTVDVADVYDIISTVQWNLNDTAIDAIFRFDVNGVTVLEAEQEPKDTSNVIFLTTFGLLDLTAGSNTIEFFARKSVGNGDILTVFTNGFTARIVDELS